ncbi:MAG: HAMP domain-containing histidine kinase [Lachnospiraceae bacterium]|nr:HAMP domain-containing histidine kinase [Lachnospiraceae bacterium]
MKKFGKLLFFIFVLFAVLFLTANLLFDHVTKKGDENTYILMNRVVNALEESADTTDPEQMQAFVDRFIEENFSQFAAEYGRHAVPDRIRFIPLTQGDSEVSILNRGEDTDKVWAFHDGDAITGLVVFEFHNAERTGLRILINAVLLAAFAVCIGILFYISGTVLKPFEKLSAYPEKLSRSEITDKLPETKNRLFGRFIWGINMLSDKLEKNKKRVNELSRDQMTMLTTIAHGIKTPVANIKLYADAIRTGLYRPDGTADESDAEVAEKISKNADEVTALVKELIDKASGTVVDFKPEIRAFYLKELTDYLEEEYSNRLKMLQIPYTFTLDHNAMINSDKSGIIRILSQLMDNAVKYGNGGGIHVAVSKEEDGYYLIVRNKGTVVEENELPYLFNSFWRGSNADPYDGSGIGLFEAREIARSLYGDIYVKADAEHSEMEFDVYLPQ